jgi:hypothetical protein
MANETKQLPELPPMTDAQLEEIATSMTIQPWGIGSRRQDAVAYARAVLSAYTPSGCRAKQTGPDQWVCDCDTPLACDRATPTP